ncbi:response regulator [bacterium]|nr:response regulator [bacterium]
MNNKPLILVVDDEKDIANDVAETIKDSGRYDAITAYSAEEGWQALEKNDIRCIVLDIKMPKRDGMDFLQKIRLIYPANKVGVILLTVLSEYYGFKKKDIERKVEGYLEKPFKSKELFKALDQYFIKIAGNGLIKDEKKSI